MQYQNPTPDLLHSSPDFEIEQLSYHGIVNMSKSHYHNHYEILYVFSGERTLHINEVATTVLDFSTICLIKPYIIHSTASRSNQSQNRYLINISEDFANELQKSVSADLMSCFNATTLSLSRSDRSIVNYLFMTMLSLDKEAADYKEAIKILLSHLLWHLSGLYKSSSNDLCTSSFSNNALRIQDVLKYINEHYSEPITEEKLANDFGFNSQYFCRIFKAYTNTSVIKYLNSIRVLNAKKMLAGRGATLESMTTSCGFNSKTNFCRVFKRITGMSPQEYRQSLKTD